MAIFIQDKHQSLDLELWRRDEQGRTASNLDEHRNPNGGSRARERENLLLLTEQRRHAAFLWYVQVDAAAGVEVEGGA